MMNKKKDINNARDRIGNLKKVCDKMEHEIKEFEEKQKTMNYKICDAENRSMQENLIFYGIPEGPSKHKKSENKNSESMDIAQPEAEIENCKLEIKAFIEENLSLDASKMCFDRAHRLGNPFRAKTPRPIIVKFHSYEEREVVRNTAYRLKDELRTKNLGVGVQIPKEWRDARKPLYSVADQERKKGNRVRFVGDQLLVNGKPYVSTTYT